MIEATDRQDWTLSHKQEGNRTWVACQGSVHIVAWGLVPVPSDMCAPVAGSRRGISCKSKLADQNTPAAGFLPAWVSLQPCEEMARAFAPFLAFLALLLLPPLFFLRRPATEEDVFKRPSPEEDRSWQASLNPPLSENPVTSLAALAAFPPPVPPSLSCSPPPLPSNPICNDTAFSGQQLQKPRKLALMLMFGFEVDTLEVQLREVADVVDVIFIVEATVTHHGVRKEVFTCQKPWGENFSNSLILLG